MILCLEFFPPLRIASQSHDHHWLPHRHTLKHTWCIGYTQWSAAQYIFLGSLSVNLYRSKGQARERDFLSWVRQGWQSMWPQGRNTSTSFPLSVQLPQLIFGFHNWYFIQAISWSIPVKVRSPALACLFFNRYLLTSSSLRASPKCVSIFAYESVASWSLEPAWACANYASPSSVYSAYITCFWSSACSSNSTAICFLRSSSSYTLLRSSARRSCWLLYSVYDVLKDASSPSCY